MKQPLNNAYDTVGALSNITYSEATPSSAYDPATFALASETIIDLQTSSTNVITRATDAFGRPAGFSLGAEYAIDYGYDTYGRFASVTGDANGYSLTNHYTYLPGSDLLSGWANDVVTVTRAHEPHRDLLTQVSNLSGTNLVSRFDYQNDELGRRTRRLDLLATYGLPMTNVFGYNPRSELTSADMGTNTYNYAFDPIGNRLTATNNAAGWTYLSNPLNQYTNVVLEGEAASEPQYDFDGNITATGDGWCYVWNGENRLILASNATHIVTYAYDHQGRMVAKSLDGINQHYLWDGYNIVQETIENLQSAITNHFVWGLDLSGTLQGAGGVGGLLAEVKDGEPYFAAFDANGNVTEYIATNGVTAAHYEYSPFGETVAQSHNPAFPQLDFTHRFSTKLWCPVTELSEYEYRKYGPGLGRWLSRDPIGERGGINVYRTLNNCAISEVDYLGLKNKIVVLFGHGSDQDEKGNWLLFEAAAWFSKLDEDDALIPFGCKTQQIRELLVKKLQTGVDSGDQQLAIMTKLAFLLTSGATWSFDMTEFNFLDLWYSMMAGLYLKRDMMCDASSNCPEDVWVSFYCQEGDEIIDKVTPIITHDYVKAIPEFKKIPAGDTFCGKTWRWSCQGKYWEYWKYGGVQ